MRRQKPNSLHLEDLYADIMNSDPVTVTDPKKFIMPVHPATNHHETASQTKLHAQKTKHLASGAQEASRGNSESG